MRPNPRHWHSPALAMKADNSQDQSGQGRTHLGGILRKPRYLWPALDRERQSRLDSAAQKLALLNRSISPDNLQILDIADLKIVLIDQLGNVPQPRHFSIVPHDRTDDTGRPGTGKPAQVHRAFCG